MPDRISRDAYGLRMAEAAASRADCTRRQVGAVVVAEDGSIVGTGYNGLASGRPGCLSEGACPRGKLSYDDQPADVGYAETGCRAVHAEVNAVIRAGRDRCIGSTIYVTDEPCFHCSVVIEAAGIVRVVTPRTNRVEQILAVSQTYQSGGYIPKRSTPHRKAALEELIGKYVDMSIPDGDGMAGVVASVEERGDSLFVSLDYGYALDANAPGFTIREIETEKEQS